MRLLLAALVLAATPAAACPPPRPTVDHVELITASGTTLPADGALLVRRSQLVAYEAGGPSTLTVREKGGTAIVSTIEPIANGLERWVLPAAADRELEVVDGAGQVVATLRQRAANGGKQYAPHVRAMTSTIGRDRRPKLAIPAGKARLELASKPPAGARFLVASLDTTHAYAMWSWPVAGGQVAFEMVSHGGKACGGAVSVIPAGERLLLTYVDELGRRSPATKVTVRTGP